MQSDKPLTELEIINRERAINEREIIAQGSFRIGRTGITVAVCEVLAVVITFASITLLPVIIPTCIIRLMAFGLLGLAIFLAIYFSIMSILLGIMRGSNEYKYQANLREFSFSRKDGKGAVAHFFYKDILSVDYCPYKILWFDSGYYVTIETKSGFFTYKYVFPRFRHSISEGNLPFEIIREQIADKKKLPEQKSVFLALSPKKTAVMLAIIAVTAAMFFVLPQIISAPVYCFVLYYALAVLGVVLCIRKILKGEEYRFRADEEEFVLRRADGVGKPTRIKLNQSHDVVYKQQLFSAAVLVKTQDKIYKFRYIYPALMQMKLLFETPFGVFEKNGGQNER